MPNPILEQAQRSGNLMPQPQPQSWKNNQQFQAAKRLYKMAQSSNNPAAMVQSLMSSNSQFQQIMNLINNSGLNPQQFFNNLAKQKGVDPDNFIQELQR